MAWVLSVSAGDPGGLAWAIALPVLAAAAAVAIPGEMRPPLQLLCGLVALVGLGFAAPLTTLAAWPTRAGILSTQGGLLLLFALRWAALVALLRAVPHRRSSLQVVDLLALAIGVALSLPLPAWVPLVGVFLLAAAARRAVPRLEAQGPLANAGHAAALLCGTWTAATLWVTLRAVLDPTPVGMAAVLAVGTGAFLAGSRAARTARHAPLLGFAGLGAAVLWTIALPTIAAPWALARVEEWPRVAAGPWAPTLLLALACAVPALLSGLAASGRPAAAASPALPLAASAAGGVLGVQVAALGPTLLPLAAAAWGGALLLFSTRRTVRLGGLALALAAAVCGVLMPPTPARELATGWFRIRASDDAHRRFTAELAASGWEAATFGPQGSWAIRRFGTDRMADIDGAPSWVGGRASSALMYAAHLPALTAPGLGRLLVVGDDLGRATATLTAHHPRQVTASISQPDLLRAWVERDPGLRAALLAPGVELLGIPAGWLVASSRPADAVLQVAAHPWTDTTGRLPDARGFRTIRAALAPGGVYVGVFAVDALSAADLAALVGSFAAVFPAGVACVPPAGADHLVLLGPAQDRPVPYARIGERIAALGESASQGSPGSPLRVADRCVIPSRRLAEWAAGVPRDRVRFRDALPRGLRSEDRLNLGVLAEAVGTPRECWDIAVADEVQPVLERRFAATAHFLSLLARSRAGDLEGLFAEAEALREASDDPGDLDALIAPHVTQALAHMERARGEGPTSRAWQQAIDALVLARMVHPRAVQPLKLLALVYEARAETQKALRLYGEARALDPFDPDLLYGLARVQATRGDLEGAEESLTEAARVRPQDWAAHQNLGVLLLRRGKAAGAEEALRRAAGSAPRDEAAPQAALAEVYLLEERPTLALAQAELALRLQPSAYHWFLKGRALYELGRKGPAEEAFYRAVLADPGFFLARGALGQILAERGDLRQAAEAFRAVLAADPGNPAALANLQQAERMLAEAEAQQPGAKPAP